ncbi:MAG: PD-(D/E)XK nuclease family transposase, partial [Proteobacteria bacterium]|nr:PD-(D/E)XK nuclease family transposase [Pseudomonadota bacterium]
MANDRDKNMNINNPDKILDPCLDVVSKMLLSSPDCRDGLIDLITRIITPPSPIVSLEILHPRVPRQIVDERGGELDLLLRLDDGSHINLEMQTTTSKILPHRALYHWAKVYSAQLKVGALHPALRAVRSIFLLKHPLYTAEPELAHHIIRAYREPLMVPAVEH